MRGEDLETVCREQINLAGPRYTPAHETDAPNLEIEEVLAAFDGLAHGAAFERRVRELRQSLREAASALPRVATQILQRRVNTPKVIEQLLEEVAASAPGDAPERIEKLRRAARYLQRSVGTIADTLRDQLRSAESETERGQIRSSLYGTEDYFRALTDLEAYLESPGAKLLGRNSLLLLGEWGTGKTHFMCDLAARRLDEGLPTLLFLAHHLPLGQEPLRAVCVTTGLAAAPGKLVEGLQALGEHTGERALLLIDGINEGDRAQWSATLEPLAQLVARHSHVGLAVSCRRPFNEQIVDRPASELYITVEHHGFEQIEFSAQTAFFDYYQIPAPTFPLLAPEFSRPLFLKLFCKAIADLAQSSKKRHLREIASGQKGMTYVLEYFAKKIGEDIEVDFALPRTTCWTILKGVEKGDKDSVGVAPLMARELREYLFLDECMDAIGKVTDLPREKQRELLHRMIADGLLAESVRWTGDLGEFEDVIQFPYQRFGDHIIARHLLHKHLNTKSPETIRRSFYGNRPLGKIFHIDEWGYRFTRPGLASAIMLEFPERVKRRLPLEERELVFYLPSRCQSVDALKEPFLEGLHWRSAEAFTEQTSFVITRFLEDFGAGMTADTFEVLVGLATRPQHPYSASSLERYLTPKQMSERDLSWSEYVRMVDEHSVVFRLLEWTERKASESLRSEDARNAILLLSLLLTTSHRPIRDRVTRALYLLGLAHPRELFVRALQSLSFNDPYVPERMLAAAYGVTMSLWADPSGHALRRELPEFARKLVQRMYLPEATHSTWHELIQEYSLGIVELARKIHPHCIATQYIRYITRPFEQMPSPFAPPTTIPDEDISGAEPAIDIDFGNYTLGGLVLDRANYDMQHGEYQEVRRQVLQRMIDLGYDHARFQAADAMIRRMQPYHGRTANGRKIDRYGKKYSWIAYFEMYGMRRSQGLLGEDIEERVLDSDIDPSFPQLPPRWAPKLPFLFNDEYTRAADWISGGTQPDYTPLLQLDEVDGIRGPWVLLDGFIEQGTGDPREVFTFLRGLLVTPAGTVKLREEIDSTTYPGNRKIPDPYDDYGIFAGELPWSKRFGKYLRNANGRPRRNVRRAFGHWDETKGKGVAVEIPVHHCTLLSDSVVNEGGTMILPAPALCAALKLVKHSGPTDLYDGRGQQATVYRLFDAGAEFGRSRLFYLRKDLLDSYLASTGQDLVWIAWGERSVRSAEMERYRLALQHIWQQRAHVHKCSVTYER